MTRPGETATGKSSPPGEHRHRGDTTTRPGANTATGENGALGRTAGNPAAGHGGQQVIGRSTSVTSTNLVGASLPVPPPGGALDHLVIPAIGLSRYVVQGVNEGDLQMGPGHYPGTPLPGQPGNVGIAGHRTTFGAPFFRLNEVSRGDLVLLTDTSGTTWVYDVVRQWVVDPGDTAVLDTTRAPDVDADDVQPAFRGHVAARGQSGSSGAGTPRGKGAHPGGGRRHGPPAAGQCHGLRHGTSAGVRRDPVGARHRRGANVGSTLNGHHRGRESWPRSGVSWWL